MTGPAEVVGPDAWAALVRGRRMRRAFADRAVDPAVVDELLDLARRAPSAGNTQSIEFLVLTGAAVERYWATTLGERRTTFRWQGLIHSPVLVIPYVHPAAYVARYGEADKAATGLGAGRDAWSVPYWWVDGGAAAEHVLLGAVAHGLGACLFGQFAHEAAVRAAFGVPDDRRAVGTIALGYPADDDPGRSAGRRRPGLEQIVHRDRWSAAARRSTLGDT